ncbi:MAG TPA: hypothetical protein VN306_00395, partial [Mycobacterium sp.]|nr:hypothetical protein [Mycobacterium sp.]
GFVRDSAGTGGGVKNIFRIAASTVVVSGGLGLAGVGAAAVAEAQPARALPGLSLVPRPVV